MQQTVLAQSVVEIIAKGVDKVRADFVKAAGSVAQFTTSAKTAFSGFGKALLATGALMSGFFAYFARGAMQGTAEGERFGKAVEFATRVIGDMFAPIVRLATTGLIQLSRSILKVPESTRLLVTWAFAAVAAITALSGAFMLLAPVFSPLISAIILLLNPMKYISLLMVAALAPIKLLGSAFSILGSAGLVGFTLLRTAIAGIVPAITSATTGVLAYGAALTSSVAAASTKAAASLLALLNPMNLVRAGIMGVQGVFASFTAIVSGTAAVFSGVFGLIGALIGPIVIGLIALEAKATGAFAPGITMGQRFASVIEAMLNLWEGVKSMGMTLYTALKPTIDWVISSFTSAWKYIMKLLGVDMDDSAQQGAGAMTSTFSSFSETIVSIFGRIREWWLKLVHFMSTKWSQAIDGIAQGLAWVGEQVGVLPKGVQDILNQDIAAQRKKDAAEQVKQMEELKAATAKAMEELKKALEKNKQKAKELAAPILEMLGLANKGGGFHIKMDVGFETLQGTFERLQKSMVSGGATVEQAQLKEMKGMRDDIQKGNAELVNIKNKVGGAVE